MSHSKHLGPATIDLNANQQIVADHVDTTVEPGVRFFCYRGLSASNPNGIGLLDQTQARTRLKLYVTDVYWQPNLRDPSTVYKSPTPPAPAVTGLQFPQFTNGSIVLFQMTGPAFQVNALGPSDPGSIFTVDPNAMVYLMINGVAADYAVRSGYFDINVAPLSP